MQVGGGGGGGGFHEYRQIWNPRIGQKLDIEQDYGSINDPFSMAIKAVLRGRIQYWETVGHIPKEISRFCYYFTMVEPSRPAYEM